MKRFVHALTDRFRAISPRPSMCAGSPGPRLPLALLAFTVPFLLSGPIRTVTSLSLGLSLCLALVFCLPVAIALWPWLRRSAALLRTPGAWVSEGMALLLLGFAIGALYNRDFGGFMNLDGWDGGAHVYVRDKFASLEPSMYQGQVSCYALTWWIERIFQTNAFRSFTMAFYLAVIAVAAIPVAIALSLTQACGSAEKVPRIAAELVTMAGMVGVLLAVVLPLMHYNQAAGYYAHMFGLVPLMAMWAGDALIRSRALRIGFLLCTFVFLRFTYALNLADAALTLAALMLVDRFPGRWRIAQAALGLALLGAALWIASDLRPIFRLWGGMQAFNVDLLLKADGQLMVAMILYMVVSSWKLRPRLWLDSPLFRTLRFPLFFGLATSVLFSIFRQGKGIQYYYVTKYQVWACILLALAFVMVVSHLSLSLARRTSLRRPTVWLRAILVVGLLTLVPSLWLKTFAGYRMTLQERMPPHGPPYKYLRPLVDEESIVRIQSVLSRNNKIFGGYLTAFFPMFSFMNATLGHSPSPGDREFFFAPDTRPGRCVFWVTKEMDIYRLGPAQNLDAIRNNVAATGATCSEYSVPWKKTPQSLCFHCY